MRRQIIPGIWPKMSGYFEETCRKISNKVVEEPLADPSCDLCGGSGLEEYGELIWDSWVCSCTLRDEEAPMGQDVLKSYHEELVQKLRNWGEWINFDACHPDCPEDGWNRLLAEVGAAFSAARDQNRNPGKPLEGQPVEAK